MIRVNSPFKALFTIVTIFTLISMASLQVLAEVDVGSVAQKHGGIYLPACPEYFEKARTSCFDIMYNPAEINDLDTIFYESGYAYDLISKFYNGFPYRTTIEVAGSHQEYEALLGMSDISESSMGSGWGDRDNGIIIIKSPDQVPNFRTVMAHELAHIATRSYIIGYSYALPLWFEEGVSVYVSDDLSDDKRRVIDDRCRQGKLLSIDEMEQIHKTSSSVTTGLDDIGAAYTESGLLIEYIENEYGEGTILNILADFGQSGDLDTAFEDCIGKTPDEVQREWGDALKLELDRRDGRILEQKVHGYVNDHHGNPMSNETVIFTALRNDSVVENTNYTAMTDNSGYYSVNVTYGPMRTYCEKPEYEGMTGEITLTRGETRFYNFTLNGTALEAKVQKAKEERMAMIGITSASVVAIAAIVFIYIRSRR